MTGETTGVQSQAWNSMIATLPGAHVLQTWEWGQVKKRFGWQALPQTWNDSQGRVVAAMLVLQRTLSLRGLATGLRMMYAPKGPLCDWGDADLRQRVLSGLARLARKQGAIFIKIDPDVLLGTGVPGGSDAQEDASGQALVADLQAAGWRFSDEQVQFRNTVLVDLRPDQEILLANMKQKTRYNIHLAERKGVTVRLGAEADLGELYRMYAETSVRDGFIIRNEIYYQTVWSTFIQAGMADLIIAEVAGQMVAAVMLFRFAGKAWYLYGMSRAAHREKMPSHLLQWEAMKRAKATGCVFYDLWGAPDEFDASDPLWDVYRFKEGLGGRVVRYIGAWDLPIRPTLYRLYTQTLPRVLDVMRRRGKERTQKLLS